MAIERFGSGGPFESRVGYSRTVRAGDLVLISGCTSVTADGAIVGGDNAYAQAVESLAAIERALALAGATLADVVQTRMYVTDISRWEDIGRAHGEVFGEIRPVTTMVQVSALIDPRLLVEIEATAHVPCADGHKRPNAPS